MAVHFLKQNTAERRELILNGSISSTILMLSLPALLLGLVQAVIPIVDGLYINNIAGTIAASAIYYSAPFVGIFGALAQGLSLAGMAIIGLANGKGDFKSARHISTQLTVAAFVSGLVLIPLMVLASFPVAAHVNGDISGAVFQYMSLSALVLPFSFMGAVYNAIKNANGRPEDTFIRIVILLFLKIAFNTLFIWILGWGLVGAVLSSLLASILISIWMYVELFIKESCDRLIIAHYRPDRHILRELVRVGFPAMLSSLILNLGFFLINNEVQKYGAVVLNGAGIASNVSNLCFLLPSSYGSAVTTLVSMNIGANREKRARAACLAGCVISFITSAVLIAGVVPLTPQLTLLFTRQPDVLAVANNAMRIYIYGIVGFGICKVLQGAFVGLGRTKVTVVISILRIWLLRYLFILIADAWLGYSAVFWGNLFSNYMTGAITVVMILRVKWVSVLSLRQPVSDHAAAAD